MWLMYNKSVFILFHHVAKEVWRLRCNFIFLFILGFVGGASYTAPLSSFHQFITNPTADYLDRHNITDDVCVLVIVISLQTVSSQSLMH